jgi:hypothetical protein
MRSRHLALTNCANMTKDPAAVALGRKGGKKKSIAKKKAILANLAKARALRHPKTPKPAASKGGKRNENSDNL